MQGVLDEIMCKAFPATLNGPARVWYCKLTPNTVSTFKELNGHFVTHFIGGQRYKRTSASLLNIKQWKDESLRSYVTRFNKEALLIDETYDKVLVIAFTNRLQSGEFLFSIYKNDLNMMAGMLYKATKYLNAKDAMTAQGGRPKKRERQGDPYQDKGRKSAWLNERKGKRRSKPSPSRMANFTQLSTMVDQVFMQTRNDLTLAWLEKLKGDLNKRPRNKYCHFHWDHRYDIFECYDLNQ